MHISKQTKKTTLAQQGRYLLICLLSMLLLFLAGSVLILNRTQRQVYEQLETIIVNIHKNSAEASERYGLGYNLVAGANIAGFEKVAQAMMAQGVV